MNVNETHKSMEIQLHSVLRDQLRNQCRHEEFLIEHIKSINRIEETSDHNSSEIEKVTISLQESNKRLSSLIEDADKCSEHIAEMKRSNEQFLKNVKDIHQEWKENRNKPPFIIIIIQKICMFIFCIIKKIGSSISSLGNSWDRPHILRKPYHIFRGPYCCTQRIIPRINDI